MPDRPKSTSPPISPPEPEAEAVFREGFLWRFAGSRHRETLIRVGAALVEIANEAGFFGDDSRSLADDEAGAALVDLRHLITDLDQAFQDTRPENERHADLARHLVRWTDRLREIESDMRQILDPQEGGSSRGDAPLMDDVREAERIARRLAEHHPDPEARRIYGQLAERAATKGRSS